MLTSTNKRYLFTFLAMFLCGASPIALNSGSSPFNGGTITSQVRAPDGASATPAYSFSAEPGNGIYRYASGVMALQAEATYSLVTTLSTSISSLYWDSTADVSFSASAPAIRGTDADTGIIFTSRALDFVWNGDAFAGLRSSGVSGTYGGFCLDASNTAPCLQVVSSGNGRLTIGAINTNYWNGYLDLGADGNVLSTRFFGTPAGYAFGNSTSTGFGSNTTNTFTIGASGGQSIIVDGNNNRIANQTATSNFWDLSACSSDPPPSGDCDADAERGRMCLVAASDKLYICDGSSRGWDHIVLTDDAGL